LLRALLREKYAKIFSKNAAAAGFAFLGDTCIALLEKLKTPDLVRQPQSQSPL
jgi:hypothetical protein